MRVRVAIGAVLLGGCYPAFVNYTPPHSSAPPTASKLVEKPRDAVWDAAVRNLEQRRYAVKDLNREAGRLTVTYSGDPERYVDCGRIQSSITLGKTETHYDFPGARAEQTYGMTVKGATFVYERRMTLAATVHVAFEAVRPGRTRVVANADYVVVRAFREMGRTEFDSRYRHTISFQSGSGAAFPLSPDSSDARCVAKGTLETEILAAID